MRLTSIAGAVLAFACLPAQAAVPGVDAFFDAMAIDVVPGRQAQFIVGDNLDGYYAGMTRSSGNGEGYVTRAGTQWLDFSSSVGGVLNERNDPTAIDQVLPWGQRLRYASGASEEMALLSKKRAVAMQVSAPQAATLAIAPLLRAPGAITRAGDAVIVAPAAGDSLWLALVGDQAFRLDEGLVLRTTAPVRSFTVVAGMGASADEAQARARAAAIDPIAREKVARHAGLTRSYLATSDAAYNKALNWAKASSASFVVEEFGSGIWAGLPWFRDNWGRDTFIALPGTLLVSGQFDQARAVLANFARYQNLKTGDANYGRIPNRVSSSTKTIYNTVDGTPWMLREALETIRYTGDMAMARQMHKLAVPYFEGAIARYTGADGLLAHDSADTWMDARIANREPWSARGPRAVEIQALWYNALQAGAVLAKQVGDSVHARQWAALAVKVQQRFLADFWDGAVMADRLRDDGSRDVKVRPNQLMLLTIPQEEFVPLPVQAKVLRNAVNALVYPYGVASLSQDEPYFHPRHENPDYHHKDAAYHQGTIWGWNAGFTVTALTKFGQQDHAWALTSNLGRQILGENVASGTLGTMSELLDALPLPDGRLKPSGTYAQSWSVAEFARNAYQDYLGFRPDLPANMLRFIPALPSAWTTLTARLPFGAQGEAGLLDVDVSQSAQGSRWRLRLTGSKARMVSFDLLDRLQRRQRVQFRLKPGQSAVLATVLAGDGMRFTLDGRAIASRVVQASFAGAIGTLAMRTPPPYIPANFPMLRSRDALQNVILHGDYR